MNRWIVRMALLSVFAAAIAGGASAQTRTVTLEWTAPGDDGFIGQAHYYDIRFSRSPISATSFLLATRLNSAILPGLAGSKEHLTVVGLTPGYGYYFAMRAMDDVGNWSPVSNIAYLPSDVASVGNQFLSLEFSAPLPNPARGGTRFAVTLPEPEWLRVEAFDLAGRKVRTLAMGQYSAGHFDLRWDMRDDSGRTLEPGAYMVRSQVGGTVFLRRVVLVQ
jgi:hypothetical protein